MTSPVKAIIIGTESFNYPTNEVLKNKLKIGNLLTLDYIDLTQRDLKEDYLTVKIIEDTNTRDVAVRVKDFASALHLTPEDFKKIQNESKLKEHIQREIKREDELETVISKVMGIALEQLHFSKKDNVIIEEEGHRFIAFNENRNIKLILIDETTILGEGTYGRALKVKNVSDETFQVIKLAQDKTGIPTWETIDSIKEEYAILAKLYEETPDESHLIGWEEKPHKLVELPLISSKSSDKVYETPPLTFGIIKSQYDSNLLTFLSDSDIDKLKLDPLWKFDCCYQLLIGLARFHEKGYWNPDLSADNIFIKKAGNFLQIDICDLSELVMPDKLSIKARRQQFAAHTEVLLEKDDILRKTLATTLSKFKKFVSKMNVFSLASILYCILNVSINLPYRVAKNEEGNDWVNEADLTDLTALNNSTIDKEIKALLRKMLNPEALKRPSISTVLTIFHKLMKAKGHNALASKYESLVAQFDKTKEKVDQTIKEEEGSSHKKQKTS